MTAILTDRLLSPRAGSPAAGLFPTPSTMRCHPRKLSETLKGIWSITSEGLLLLWMLTVGAFSLLIAAGAVGFLG